MSMTLSEKYGSVILSLFVSLNAQMKPNDDDLENQRMKNQALQNLKKNPRRSILRAPTAPGPSGTMKDPSVAPSKKSTRWDEKNIRETLHPQTKDYGHMKIPECKTPYERELNGKRQLDPNVLADRLELISKGIEEDERIKEEKKKAFEEKKKQHYKDQFKYAKERLKAMTDEEESS